MIYKKRNESSIVSSVGKYLQVLENARRIAFWSRQQAGRLPIQNKNGSYRSVRLGREGVADLWCMIAGIRFEHGKMVWIECKLEGGKQSPAQIEFEKIANKCGHYYWLIRDCDELERKFKEIGVI